VENPKTECLQTPIAGNSILTEAEMQSVHLFMILTLSLKYLITVTSSETLPELFLMPHWRYKLRCKSPLLVTLLVIF